MTARVGARWPSDSAWPYFKHEVEKCGMTAADRQRVREWILCERSAGRVQEGFAGPALEVLDELDAQDAACAIIARVRFASSASERGAA